MQSPKISIIVPIYNVEKYLDRCIQSLLGQTLKEIEIILVDDGSPDKCPSMCEEYAKVAPRIKVIHKQNEGLGLARNSGLEIATGEYVAFVDSDDYVEKSMFATLYTKASKKDLDVIYCGFYKQNIDGTFKRISECETYTEYNKSNIQRLIPDFIASEPYCKNEYKHDMSVWHSIYKNKIIKNNHLQFVSERIYSSEDIPFQIDFLKRAEKIAFIPDNFYYYCYNGESLTKNVDFEKFDRIKKLYSLITDKTKDVDPNGLRVKRLFVGYTRAILRRIVSSQMSRKDKNCLIYKILKDSVWNDIKAVYKLSYFPLKQRVMTSAIYSKSLFWTKITASLMEFKSRL